MNLLEKISIKTLLAIAFIGLALFSGLIFFAIYQKNRHIQKDLVVPTNITITDEKEKRELWIASASKIPNIGVDAPIEYVGTTANGEMDIPKGPSSVGWFESGTRPGENGSAVIAGHYGRWKNGEGSVFDDLSKLKERDSIYVEDESGITSTFIVREFQSFEPDADASAVFVSSDDKAHLNLITCEGTWNKNSKSYSKRLVVFADKKME